MFSPRPSALALAVTAALLAQFLVPGRARAQLAPVLQYNYGSDVSGSAVSGVGAGLRFPLRAWNQKRGLMGVMTFDYFFAPDYPVADGSKHQQTYWEINMDGTYDLPKLKAILYRRWLQLHGAERRLHRQCPRCHGNCPRTQRAGGMARRIREGRERFVQGRAELWGGKQVVVSGGVYF